MSSIKSSVNELKQINLEIKRLTVHLRSLRQRANDVERDIVIYLDSKEQHGVKYDGTAIMIDNKPKRMTKKKKDVESDSISILQNYGIDNAKEVLNEILEARKGKTIDNQKIKIKKIN